MENPLRRTRIAGAKDTHLERRTTRTAKTSRAQAIRDRRFLLFTLGALTLVCVLGFSFYVIIRRSRGVERGRQAGVIGPRASNVDTLDEILWWLPADTQSVIVAKGPFSLESLTPSADVEPSFETSLAAALSPLLPNFCLRNGKLIPSATVSLVVEGSRKFHAPKRLGMMPYEGSVIIIFREDLVDNGERLRRAWQKNASRMDDISGQPVAVFEDRVEDDIWTAYLAIPRPNIVIYATSREYLGELMVRMSGKRKGRALPDDLPEWKHLDSAASFWAVRHFDREDGTSDPSSPFGDRRPAANELDEQAIGFVFMFAPPREYGTIVYLSKSDNAAEIAGRVWKHPHEQLVPKIQMIEPGVVQVTISLGNPQGRRRFLLILMSVLGHGLYL